METAQTAKPLFGNKLYQQRAREALPILVRQVTANQIISYSDLATELGMFQCVKYRAVIEAFQVIQGCQSSCRVLLALESKLPAELLQMKNILGIEVIEQIVYPSSDTTSDFSAAD